MKPASRGQEKSDKFLEWVLAGCQAPKKMINSRENMEAIK